jgi:hypothetical protein
MKIFIKNTLLTIGVTFLIILLIEVALKVFRYPTYDEFRVVSAGGITQITPGAGWSYRPNVINQLYPVYPGDLKTDATGLIHNGTPRTKKDLIGAIFIFGGSTVEGRGSSSNTTTIPAQIEKCLRPKITNSVVNFGLSVDMSFQEMQRAVGIVMAQYSPAMLVFLDGRNDAYYLQRTDWKPFDSNPGIYSPFGFINNKVEQPPWLRLLHNARAISSLVNLAFTIREHPNHLVGQYENPSPQKNSLAANAYLASHNGIDAMAKQMGIPSISFLQPTLGVGEKIITAIELEKMNKGLEKDK